MLIIIIQLFMPLSGQHKLLVTQGSQIFHEMHLIIIKIEKHAVHVHVHVHVHVKTPFYQR